MSDLVDKIIILFLVIILPINILISSKMSEEGKQGEIEKEIEKIDRSINELESKLATQKKEDLGVINIMAVKYASNSGELVVEGEAPIRNLNVMVSAAVTAKELVAENPKRENEVEVLGKNIEMLAVKTDENGKFRLIKKVDKEKVELIELRFDQDRASVTIQYDFELDKRTL